MSAHTDNERSEAAVDVARLVRPLPPVLDACCGSRMFWFDRLDGRALFVDRRRERHECVDASMVEGVQRIEVAPDIQCDFTDLPFDDDTFAHVVFDPPHLLRAGATGFLAKKYGVLVAGWEEMLTAGFAECFRVLIPMGTLVFKWSSVQIPIDRVLRLTEHQPLYGHRSGRNMQTHWVAFIKTNAL